MGKSSYNDILSTKYVTRTSKKNSFNRLAVESAGIFQSQWIVGSTSTSIDIPPRGVMNFPMSGQALYMTTSGAIQYLNAPSGMYNYITSLRKLAGSTQETVNGIVDFLWMNSGIVLTGSGYSQSIDSVEWPQRDDSGLSTGYGVYAAIYIGVSTTQSSQFGGITISYTNTNNVPNRTGTILFFPQTAVSATFIPFSLDSADTGVKSIQSIYLPRSLVGTTTGTAHLVAFRPITMMATFGAEGMSGPFSMGFTKIFNNSCLTQIGCSSSAGQAFGNSLDIEMVMDY